MLEKENESKIEGIKRRLYEPFDTVTHRTREGTLHRIHHDAREGWENNELNTSNMNTTKKPKTSIFKKFFILSIIFFFIALGFAYYKFSTGGTSVSNENIDIKVVGSAFTKGGEELPLQIEITNRNKASLVLSDLQISYPNGASDNIADYIRLPRISVGTIKPGETVIENIKVVLFGDEKSNREINIDYEYHPEGSNAIFTKSEKYIVNLTSAPLSITIDAPETVTSDQPISFNVVASLNTTLPNANTVMMQITYPNNFVYESATPAPSFGNSMWSLDSLSLTNPVSVVVKGRIIGQDQEQEVFHVYTGETKETDKSTIEVVYNSLIHTATIVKPFLAAEIIADDTTSSGENVNVSIAWANNLSTRVTGAQITASLGGNVYDKSSVKSNVGFFDSANNRIVWDQNSDTDLASIEPGEKGEVSFSMKSIPLALGQNLISNGEMTIDVSIKGSQPSLGSTYADINNFSKKVIKILSDFQIASSVTFNAGALPPKAEKETKYNVTWTLSNSLNPISGAVARATLPVYVKWVGSSSSKENVTYNEATREVIWNIGSVRENTGSLYNREASFVIALSPSVSQVGSTPQLMGDLFLSGTDSFTGTIVKSKSAPINTVLSGSPNFQSGQERVIQ